MRKYKLYLGMFKLVAFDFDGTLVNSLPNYILAYDLALKSFGLNFSKDEIVSKCFGKKEDDICKSLGRIEITTEFRDKYFSEVNNHLKELKQFYGVATTLNFLKKNNIKLAIATFASRWYIDKALEVVDLKKNFDLVMSSNDVEKSKPDPEMLFKISQESGVSIDEMLMIGDSSSDILMANNANCKSVWFAPIENEEIYDYEILRKTIKPDYIARDYGELEKIILK